jgi:hypothetical protein
MTAGWSCKASQFESFSDIGQEIRNIGHPRSFSTRSLTPAKSDFLQECESRIQREEALFLIGSNVFKKHPGHFIGQLSVVSFIVSAFSIW